MESNEMFLPTSSSTTAAGSHGKESGLTMQQQQ